MHLQLRQQPLERKAGDAAAAQCLVGLRQGLVAGLGSGLAGDGEGGGRGAGWKGAGGRVGGQ